MNQESREATKYNTLSLGVIIGVVAPIIFFLIYYLSRFASNIDFFPFIQSSYKTGKLVQIASLCVFPNGLVFMRATKTNRMTLAKGILTATVIFAVTIFFVRLFS